MKNMLILHGHFYQPPRENPDTGVVPRQPSAAPFRDWNARITRECYGANAASRYLNQEGRILDIINNYASISFNFGPTLLNWLRKNAPSVYRGIIEADRESKTRNNGHGNALAQSYNHTILPLDSPEIRKTQIAWGISDFESHFGRKPEGMWLPETAVNTETAQDLADSGIRFIILSPWQADSVRRVKGKKWSHLGKGPVPYGRPYRLHGIRGDLAVFFYNHQLAEGISFQHFLTDAEKLYSRLLEFAEPETPSHLIHTATDGEVYGHHEPFGDMCLAALIKRVRTRDDFELTNYAAYLEQFPPEHEVKLKSGEEERGTSWSCAHGVSRWYKDCGCSTGGKEKWNQEWRGPLRKGFDFLYEQAKDIFLREMPSFSSEDPYEILREYGTVECSDNEKLRFSEQRMRPDRARKKADIERFFRLLEGQKYAMYMYTSCGWFFAEISGLEPVQNMKYAYEAFKHYAPYFENSRKILDDFTNILKTAPSNIEQYKNGAEIFEQEVVSLSLPVETVAALCAVQYFTGPETAAGRYGYFSSSDYTEEYRGQDGLHYKASLTMEDCRTLAKSRFSADLDISEHEHPVLTLTGPTAGRKRNISLVDLPVSTRELLVETYQACLPAPPDAGPFSGPLKCAVNILSFAKTLRVDPPFSVVLLAEYQTSIQLKTVFSRDLSSFSKSTIKTVRKILRDARLFGLRIDEPYLRQRISGLLAETVDRLSGGTINGQLDLVIDLLEISREAGIAPETAISQNKIFALMKKVSVTGGDSALQEKLITAADHLGIAVDM